MSIVQQEATRSYGHAKRAQGRCYEDEDVLRVSVWDLGKKAGLEVCMSLFVLRVFWFQACS